MSDLTYNDVFPHVSLAWGILSLGLLLVAWRAARQRHWRLHGMLMAVLTAGAWLFIAGYMLSYRMPGERPHIDPAWIPWIAFHGSVALIPLFGATALLYARLRQRFDPRALPHLNRQHRRYGQVFAATWTFTHAGGLFNYWLFYM